MVATMCSLNRLLTPGDLSRAVETPSMLTVLSKAGDQVFFSVSAQKMRDGGRASGTG